MQSPVGWCTTTSEAGRRCTSRLSSGSAASVRSGLRPPGYSPEVAQAGIGDRSTSLLAFRQQRTRRTPGRDQAVAGHRSPLALTDCTTEPIDVGTKVTLSCFQRQHDAEGLRQDHDQRHVLIETRERRRLPRGSRRLSCPTCCGCRRRRLSGSAEARPVALLGPLGRQLPEVGSGWRVLGAGVIRGREVLSDQDAYWVDVTSAE